MIRESLVGYLPHLLHSTINPQDTGLTDTKRRCIDVPIISNRLQYPTIVQNPRQCHRRRHPTGLCINRLASHMARDEPLRPPASNDAVFCGILRGGGIRDTTLGIRGDVLSGPRDLWIGDWGLRDDYPDLPGRDESR